MQYLYIPILDFVMQVVRIHEFLGDQLIYDSQMFLVFYWGGQVKIACIRH